MATPRRHHLLPQFYMRAFADEEGKARVIERASGREFTTGTTNVLVERDYYTVSSVDAEDDHEPIEGVVTALLKRGHASWTAWSASLSEPSMR